MMMPPCVMTDDNGIRAVQAAGSREVLCSYGYVCTVRSTSTNYSLVVAFTSILLQFHLLLSISCSSKQGRTARSRTPIDLLLLNGSKGNATVWAYIFDRD